MNFGGKFRFANHTDVGKSRKQNEDAMGFFEAPNGNGYVFVVCDGMGGHLGGAVASQTAIKAIRYFLELEYFSDPKEAIKQAITFANQEIYHKAQTSAELKNMGTTCVMVIYRNGQCFIGHVGDSRLYLYRDGLLNRITKDHSFVQMLVDQNVITEEEAEEHPRRNEILRALGTEAKVEVEVRQTPFVPQIQDTLLLCTDGLNSMLTDTQIEAILDERADIQQKALKLVESANIQGGLDNITVQLIEFLVGNPPPQIQNLKDTNPLGITTPDFPAEEQKKKVDEDIIPEIAPAPKKKQSRRIDEHDMVVGENLEHANKLRTLLLQVFGGMFLVIFLYVMVQTVLDDVNFFGSKANITIDSLKAIRVQERFYEYFWESNPKLKKAKDKIKETYKETQQTIQELRAMKNQAKEAVNKLFHNDKIQYIKNQLPTNFSTQQLEELAKKYGSKIDWILKANGVKSKEDLKKLDSLFIPKTAPKDTSHTNQK